MRYEDEDPKQIVFLLLAPLAPCICLPSDSGGFSNILSFSECMYSSDLGVYYSYTCSGSSKKVAVGYYSAYSCDFDFYTGVATLYDDSDCDSGIIGYCASTGEVMNLIRSTRLVTLARRKTPTRG